MEYNMHCDTPIGPVTIVANKQAITALHFGAAGEQTQQTALLCDAAAQLLQYFAGTRQRFYLPLAPDGTEFQKKVWNALLQIPYGCTRSYGDIARAIGEPGASRAVGMANNKNPIAILIPCHRVIGSDGSLTGYAGGLDVKEHLLRLERDHSKFFRISAESLQYLSDKDARMANAIRRYGNIEFTMSDNVFESLCQCIVGQQISTRSADTVWRRMQEKFGAIRPETIVLASEEEIQSCGMYARKAMYIKHAAEAVLAGEIDLQALYDMPDDEVAQALEKLPGVGDWTVEMILIFTLGRMDVMSYSDYGIRRGIMKLYGLKELTKKQFMEYKKRYSPYATVAGFYLWHISADPDEWQG